ncbi:MAG: M23 family metallopeptidase [Gemmatimonadaceae bacterium]
MSQHSRPRLRPRRQQTVAAGVLCLLATACEIDTRDAEKQDTTTLPAAGTGATPADSDVGDTLSGVPAVPDSARVPAGSVTVRIWPDQPQRGGVVVALAEGVGTAEPRCEWKGAELPCYPAPGGGVLAIAPLPADEPAGTFTLAIEYPSRRVTRQVRVADRAFGRELIFLRDSLYELVTERADIARESRVLRRILSSESVQRMWSGEWREPVDARESAGYGVERFYFAASDSTRSIELGPEMRTGGTFALDTTTVVRGAPGWRHAGIDLSAARNTRVRAPEAGTVAEVGDYTLTGRTLLIDHGQGIYTAYFHLDTVVVRKGEDVRSGATVARVGATGLATGPHLHYGVYVHGKDVDPAVWALLPEFARDTTPR